MNTQKLDTINKKLMREINYNNVYDFLYSLLNSQIKERHPGGYDACLACGEYHHHKLIYCKRCGKKIEAVKEMSWANFQTIVGKSGAGVMITIENILFNHFDAKFFENRDRYNQLLKIYKKINIDKLIRELSTVKK
jgi:hypothetical protein